MLIDSLESLGQVSISIGFAFVFYFDFCLLVDRSYLCGDGDSKTMLGDQVADIFVGDGNNQPLSSVGEGRDEGRDENNSPGMEAYCDQIDLHVEEVESTTFCLIVRLVRLFFVKPVTPPR